MRRMLFSLFARLNRFVVFRLNLAKVFFSKTEKLKDDHVFVLFGFNIDQPFPSLVGQELV